MIEVTQQINSVQRAVGTRSLPAGEARTMTISQSYHATIDDLWDACTSAERIPRWFLPVSGDLRLGGRFQIEGNASGTIERCDPPKGFTATWEFGGSVSWIEVSLSAGADGWTKLELAHIGHIDDQSWAEFGPGAIGIGWDMALMGLAIHLSSGDVAGPERIAAWPASADGRKFMTLSSERWRDASIAAGTDETSARAAADRCTAAYTGAAQ
jgi:uncharacterized protein YndB with AHSA1/START domain